jgi:hypothetical protein
VPYVREIGSGKRFTGRYWMRISSFSLKVPKDFKRSILKERNCEFLFPIK